MTLSAKEAAAKAGKGDGVIGWALDDDQRAELLQQFPPKFSDAVADHVTLAAKARRDAELPCERLGEIVGRVDDGEGVETLVVSIDGSTYHITWSLEKARGRKAKESNEVIARLGWTPIDLPMPVKLVPRRWP